MLLKKTFYRELVSNASKILIILIFILPLTELFKLLEQATSGHIAATTLLSLMLFGTIASFPMILNISCFLTVVITINRYCKDAEFTIWLSSGVSPFYWLTRVFYFVLPFSIICGICSMLITPWAMEKSRLYTEYMIKQELSMSLAPGVFKESNDGQNVFYLEHYSLLPSLANKIFIQYHDPNNNIDYNITALSGRIDSADNISSIILENGHRVELNNHESDNIMLNFKQFKASIKQNYQPSKKELDVQTTSTKKLFKTNEQKNHVQAELGWRLSVAIMTLSMALISLPLSIQISRIQNSLIFIFPPLLYAIYQNLVFTVKAYIKDGVLSSFLYVIPLHLLVCLIAILLTYYKSKPKGHFFR